MVNMSGKSPPQNRSVKNAESDGRLLTIECGLQQFYF
jgi:hypothetical protein